MNHAYRCSLAKVQVTRSKTRGVQHVLFFFISESEQILGSASTGWTKRTAVTKLENFLQVAAAAALLLLRARYYY